MHALSNAMCADDIMGDKSLSTVELQLDETCSLHLPGMALSEKLGVVTNIHACTIDKILMSASPQHLTPALRAQATAAPTNVSLQMAGLVLGSAQQHKLSTQLHRSGIPVWFVDPLVAVELVPPQQFKMQPLVWPTEVKLPPRMRVVLRTTAYVGDDTKVTIRGVQNTIVPHSKQFKVQVRGVLELSNVTITGS